MRLSSADEMTHHLNAKPSYLGIQLSGPIHSRYLYTKAIGNQRTEKEALVGKNRYQERENDLLAKEAGHEVF